MAAFVFVSFWLCSPGRFRRLHMFLSHTRPVERESLEYQENDWEKDWKMKRNLQAVCPSAFILCCSCGGLANSIPDHHHHHSWSDINFRAKFKKIFCFWGMAEKIVVLVLFALLVVRICQWLEETPEHQLGSLRLVRFPNSLGWFREGRGTWLVDAILYCSV